VNQLHLGRETATELKWGQVNTLESATKGSKIPPDRLPKDRGLVVTRGEGAPDSGGTGIPANGKERSYKQSSLLQSDQKRKVEFFVFVTMPAQIGGRWGNNKSDYRQKSVQRR